MALTIKEQLDIIGGTITPSDSAYTLTQLALQVGFDKSQDFLANVKSFDSGTYPLAYNYKSKLLNYISRFLENQVIINSIASMLISLYGKDPASSFATVTTAPTSAWVTFINNNMVEVIEYLSGVLPEEKTEYINI